MASHQNKLTAITLVLFSSMASLGCKGGSETKPATASPEAIAEKEYREQVDYSYEQLKLVAQLKDGSPAKRDLINGEVKRMEQLIKLRPKDPAAYLYKAQYLNLMGPPWAYFGIMALEDAHQAGLDFGTSIFNAEYLPIAISQTYFLCAKNLFEGREFLQKMKAHAPRYAKLACDQSIKYNPKNADSFLLRSEINFSEGLNDEAMRDGTMAIRLKPSARGYMSRSALFAYRGNFELAIADMNDSLRLDPQNPVSYLARSQFFLRAEEPLKGLKDLNTAIRLNPKMHEAYFHRGVVLSQMGKFSAADRDFDTVLGAEPNNIAGRVQRAKNYVGWSNQAEKTGDAKLRQTTLSLAVENLDHAIKMTPVGAARTELMKKKSELRENYGKLK